MKYLCLAFLLWFQLVSAAPVELIMKDGRRLKSDTNTMVNGTLDALEDGVWIKVLRSEVAQFRFPSSQSTSHKNDSSSKEETADSPQQANMSSCEASVFSFDAAWLEWIKPETRLEIAAILYQHPELVQMIMKAKSDDHIRELLHMSEIGRIYTLMRGDILYHMRNEKDVSALKSRCDVIYSELKGGKLSVWQIEGLDEVQAFLLSRAKSIWDGSKSVARKYGVLIPRLKLSGYQDFYEVGYFFEGGDQVALVHRNGVTVVELSELSSSMAEAVRGNGSRDALWELPVWEALVADLNAYTKKISSPGYQKRIERLLKSRDEERGLSKSDLADRRHTALCSLMRPLYRDILEKDPRLSIEEFDWLIQYATPVWSTLKQLDAMYIEGGGNRDEQARRMNALLPSHLLEGDL